MWTLLGREAASCRPLCTAGGLTSVAEGMQYAYDFTAHPDDAAAAAQYNVTELRSDVARALSTNAHLQESMEGQTWLDLLAAVDSGLPETATVKEMARAVVKAPTMGLHYLLFGGMAVALENDIVVMSPTEGVFVYPAKTGPWCWQQVAGRRQGRVLRGTAAAPEWPYYACGHALHASAFRASSLVLWVDGASVVCSRPAADRPSTEELVAAAAARGVVVRSTMPVLPL